MRDGGTVEIRPIEPRDRANLIRFHETLSPSTIRKRFLGIHPHLSADETDHFVTVDHRDREALIAVADDTIVAVGRYERLPDSTDAEVAFVVTDRCQGSGLTPILLQRLVVHARTVGIRRFLADTLQTNRPMIQIFMNSGMPTTTSSASGVLNFSMSL